MIISEYTMWAIPLFFYIWDRILLIDENQVILVEGLFCDRKILFSGVPFTWRNKNLYLCNLLVPYGASYVIKISQSADNDTLSEIVIHKPGIINRFVSISSTINFVLIGPILTNNYGLYLSIPIVFLLHLLNLIIASFVYQPSDKKASAYFLGLFEFFVCPGYLMNFVVRSQPKSDMKYEMKIDRVGTLISDLDLQDLKRKLEIRAGI